MGGAARNDKKRRQDDAERRLAAAGIRVPPKKATNRTPVIVVAVVLAVAVVIGAAVLLTRSGSDAVTGTYTATQSGAVTSAGTGPVVVDVYEDFLCPVCERFEQRYGPDLTTALNAGQITVRYHAIAILDERTKPAGYSTRAANAGLCSAAAGIFPAYHAKLFAEQPAEGSAGLTDQQLIAFGTGLGAAGGFADCVTGAKNAAAVTAETNAAAATPALQLDGGGFGTPTIAVGGKKVDLNDANWLKNAIAAG